jgi:hypothetical protein
MSKIGLERTIQLVGLDRSRKSLLEAYSRLQGTAPALTELPVELTHADTEEESLQTSRHD